MSFGDDAAKWQEQVRTWPRGVEKSSNRRSIINAWWTMTSLWNWNSQGDAKISFLSRSNRGQYVTVALCSGVLNSDSRLKWKCYPGMCF